MRSQHTVIVIVEVEKLGFSFSPVAADKMCADRDIEHPFQERKSGV